MGAGAGCVCAAHGSAAVRRACVCDPPYRTLHLRRRMEAVARMREAFTGGVSPGVDIFAAAAALVGPALGGVQMGGTCASLDMRAAAGRCTWQSHLLWDSCVRAWCG